MTDTTGSPCDICAAPTTGVAVETFKLCDDPRCAEIAKQHRDKGPSGFTFAEQEAITRAGKAGGAFLMGPLGGRTDLIELQPEEWARFVTEIVSTYRSQLRAAKAEGIPF